MGLALACLAAGPVQSQVQSQIGVAQPAAYGGTEIAAGTGAEAGTESEKFLPIFVALLQQSDGLLREFQQPPASRRSADLRDPAPDEQSETFRLLVREAVRRHPSIRSGVLAELQAREAVSEARAVQFPRVSLSFDGGHRRGSTDSRLARNGFQSDAVLSVSQLLFDAGATFNRIDAADYQAVAERYGSLTRAQQFALRAISVFLDVIALETKVLLAEDNLENHRLILDQVRARSEGGVGTQADLYRAEGRLADARSILINLTGQYEQMVSAYRELFGRSPSVSSLPATLPETRLTVQEAVEMAQARNPALNRATAQTRSARYSYEAERSNWLPSVSVEVAGRRFVVNNPYDNDYDVATFLRVDYPLFDGGAREARRGRAMHKLSQAREDEHALQLDVERQVRTAMTDITTRMQRLRSLELAAQADQQTLVSYLDLFTIGRRSLTDVLEAQQDLFSTRTALVDERIALDLAHYVLAGVTGQLLDIFEVGELPYE